MASSFPFSLDLNLAPPTQTYGQGAAPVWIPYFTFSRGPVIVNDSLLIDNDVAIGDAKSLVALRDVRMLGTWDDNKVVSDAMTLSMQSAVSVASVGHRLIVKSHEVQMLRAQLVVEWNLVEYCQRVIRSLKREKAKTTEENRHQLEILQKENQKLSKMVDYYSQDMQKQLEALDRFGQRKQRDHDTSYDQTKCVIFGSSNDQP